MKDVFRPGDKVRVEFEGVVEEPSWHDGRDMFGVLRDNCAVENGEHFGFYHVRDANGIIHMVWRRYTDEGNVITRTAPRDWPPEAGDVWETGDGKTWFARKNTIRSGEVVLISDSGSDSYYQSQTDDFKAMKPRLLHRKNAA
jgi:hypothetical protein